MLGRDARDHAGHGAGQSAAAQRRLIVHQDHRPGQSLDLPHHAERGDAGRGHRHQRLQAAQCLHRRSALREHQCRDRQCKSVRRYIKSLGGQILADIGFGRDANDFTAIATRIAGVGKVDVIPTYTLEGQGLRITQALAQAGVTKGGGGTAIQLGTIWLPFGFEQKAGKAALGYVRIVQFDPTDKRELVQNFVRAFRAKYNQEPTHLNAHAYDQIMVVADAVRRGGKDPQSIRDALAATKNFSGVTGSVEFDKSNQNVKMDTIHYMETLPDLSWKALAWN